MLLLLLLAILLGCGGLAFLIPHRFNQISKAVCYVGISLSLLILALVFMDIKSQLSESKWLIEFKVPWIAVWRINFHLAMDNWSFWWSLLALVMGLLAIFCARPQHKANSYYAAIMGATLFVIGLFLSADIFLFFIFWELALLPIYWMLIVHGTKQQSFAALRFIILTQISGLLLLISVVGLAYAHFNATGELSFDYQTLLSHPLPPELQYYLLLGFLLAFLIKLPVFPFHGWIAPLFSEAPAPIILVGILVKTAIFGMMRFSWPLFPNAMLDFALPVMLVAVFSILYGAIVAFGQMEPKRLLAYSTLSHAGMLLLGVFCQTETAILGVLLLMLAQALSTGGLLMMIDRFHVGSTSITWDKFSGLWGHAPKFSCVLLILLLAGIGFPIFANFVGEWLVLWAVFSVSKEISILASLSIILSAVYSLWLFQRLCLRETTTYVTSVFAEDLKRSEVIVYGFLIVLLVAIAFYPSPILSQIKPPFFSEQQAQVVLP